MYLIFSNTKKSYICAASDNAGLKGITRATYPWPIFYGGVSCQPTCPNPDKAARNSLYKLYCSHPNP